MDDQTARELLERERDRLEALGRQLRDECADDTTLPETHDPASEVFEREKDLSILHRVEVDLRDVTDALTRLANGAYGRCTTCRGAIPDDRLEAVPATRFCAEHEGMWEADRLSLSVPAGAYEDGSEGSADRRAAREAGANLDLLPDDDDVVERLELGPEQVALHLSDPARPDPEALTAEEVAVLEQRRQEWADEDRAVRVAALDEAEER